MEMPGCPWAVSLCSKQSRAALPPGHGWSTTSVMTLQTPKAPLHFSWTRRSKEDTLPIIWKPCSHLAVNGQGGCRRTVLVYTAATVQCQPCQPRRRDLLTKGFWAAPSPRSVRRLRKLSAPWIATLRGSLCPFTAWLAPCHGAPLGHRCYCWPCSHRQSGCPRAAQLQGAGSDPEVCCIQRGIMNKGPFNHHSLPFLGVTAGGRAAGTAYTRQLNQSWDKQGLKWGE